MATIKLTKGPEACKAAKPDQGLGPKQLQWCRDNLGNFAKYEQQVLASKGEQAETIVKDRRHD